MVEVTYEEVEDGHVYDVEEPVARVIGIQLLYGVAEEGIHFPPWKTDMNDTVEKLWPRNCIIYLLFLTRRSKQFEQMLSKVAPQFPCNHFQAYVCIM